MKLTLLFALLAFSFTAFGQSYKIGHRQITWTDSSRNNRPVKFEVYYPATTAGENVPVVNKKFSLVVFGHGYQLTYSDYLWLKDSMVPRGFFLVFPRTEEQLFPSHSDFAKDYAFLINTFDATKTIQSNWYYNKVKNKYAVGGHSMGGGCSLLSVQYSSKISAVFNFAAAETDPSAIVACTGIAIPALLFAGGKDCISPPSSNQIPMYNNIQNVCKTYVSITAAKHCQWANNDGVCRAGEFFCSPLSASPKATLTTTFRLLQPWLNDKLNGNKAAANNFQNLLTSGTNFTFQQNCGANNSMVEERRNTNVANTLKVYPSIANAGTIVNVIIPAIENNTSLQVFNQSGKLVYTNNILQANNQQQQIATANFKKGIYFIVINDGGNQYKNTFVIE